MTDLQQIDAVQDDVTGNNRKKNFHLVFVTDTQSYGSGLSKVKQSPEQASEYYRAVRC
jgi:hypothetical protein